MRKSKVRKKKKKSHLKPQINKVMISHKKSSTIINNQHILKFLDLKNVDNFH